MQKSPKAKSKTFYKAPNSKNINKGTNSKHVSSKISSSNVKNNSTPYVIQIKSDSKQKSSQNIKTKVVSISESQQIGNSQYKKAMKHMLHLKMIQQQIQKSQKLDKITEEHTFKPKINHTYKIQYLNNKTRLNKTSLQDMASSIKSKESHFYDRLMKWGKQHDERVRTNYIKGKVPKTDHQGLNRSLQLSREHMNASDIINKSIQFEQLQKMQKKLYRKNGNMSDKKPVKGQQDYYLRQARAVALRNKQIFYYKTLNTSI